ncbi:MAG: hypothetical protein H6734_14105 [Alphaproteobacteria bacterium]|nr:hypothetical protein [Alphaproteobacteria bacterium]
MSRAALGSILLAVLVSGCKVESDLVVRGNQPGLGQVPEPINPVQVDRILQVNRPAIDVLFVVDNSCSMEQEQANLAQNFPQFMNYFLGSGIDYHIGVISTDMVTGSQAGKLQSAQGYRYIDEETPNPTNVFAQMATVGADGNWEERGRDAVYTAIELRGDDPTNVGFYRPEAGLELVFVSDEDDVSRLISAPEFLEWFEGLKWSPERTNAHAIVTPLDVDSCPDGLTAGTKYLNLAQATGGQTFNICALDWAPMLDSLGLATSGLRMEYFLSSLPVVDTIEVVVKNPEGITFQFVECMAGEEIEDETCEVVYNPARNSIVFLDAEPEPYSEVTVTYNLRENFSEVATDGEDAGNGANGGE